MIILKKLKKLKPKVISRYLKDYSIKKTKRRITIPKNRRKYMPRRSHIKITMLIAFLKSDYKMFNKIIERLCVYGHNKRVYPWKIRTSSIHKIRKELNIITTFYNTKSEEHKDLTALAKLLSYRSNRHKKMLPARGQRTKTNAKTNRKKFNSGKYDNPNIPKYKNKKKNRFKKLPKFKKTKNKNKK